MTDRVVAVVLAGGSGTRMRTDANKVYLDMAGLPILAYSLAALEACTAVTDLVLVARPADVAATDAVIDRVAPTKLRAVVAGGSTRQGSEIAGLLAVRHLPGVTDDDLVLLHDGARPFLTVELVDALVVAAREHGGAVPGLPFDGAVHEAVGPSGLRPVGTDDLRRVQTPQAFRLGPLLAAYDAVARNGFDGVDTADTVQHYGTSAVAFVDGDPRNLKVTTPDDLVLAAQLATVWRDGRWTDEL